MYRIVSTTTLFFILTVLIWSCSPSASTDENADKKNIINPTLGFRPNILWLVAEDQSPNIPSFGDSTIATPTLSWLASQGVCYDNFFSAHPVCAPARASIITGMYANHIAASHMRTGPWSSHDVTQKAIDAYSQRLSLAGIKAYEAMPPAETKMFTEFLRTAGYYCTNNAKEDYQFRKTMTAWDESSKQAHWRNRAKGQPFFAVFNFEVTHESQIWAKANDSLWVDKDINVPIPPYLPDTEVGVTDVRRMYSNIVEMDAKVSKVLDQLKADGLLDSTIVVWYTDHGGPLPRQKRLLYDAGIKVPMIIRFPNGQFASMRDDRMISFIDLAPTMLSLVGIEPKKYMDGKAFLGQFIRTEEPTYVFGAADRFDELTDRNRSARDNRYKYIRYYMPEKPMIINVAYRQQMPIMKELLRLYDEGKLTETQSLWFRETKPKEEFFDTWNDPHEIHNLAGDPAYAEKLTELSTAMDQWLQSFDDTGLKDEKDLVAQIWPNGKQPVTTNPVITLNNGKAQITCTTEGASIGYKIVREGDDGKAMSWKIYTNPFELPAEVKLITVADRIGYIRSEEVSYK